MPRSVGRACRSAHWLLPLAPAALSLRVLVQLIPPLPHARACPLRIQQTAGRSCCAIPLLPRRPSAPRPPRCHGACILVGQREQITSLSPPQISRPPVVTAWPLAPVSELLRCLDVSAQGGEQPTRSTTSFLTSPPQRCTIHDSQHPPADHCQPAPCPLLSHALGPRHRNLPSTLRLPPVLRDCRQPILKISTRLYASKRLERPYKAAAHLVACSRHGCSASTALDAHFPGPRAASRPPPSQRLRPAIPGFVCVCHRRVRRLPHAPRAPRRLHKRALAAKNTTSLKLPSTQRPGREGTQLRIAASTKGAVLPNRRAHEEGPARASRTITSHG